MAPDEFGRCPPRRGRVTVTTENVHEPETFVQVAPRFEEGFLVLEGLWDTYFVRQNLIREIRFVEEDYSLTINYTPAEWRAEVNKKKRADEDTKVDAVESAIVAKINSGDEKVEVDDDGVLIEKANERLKAKGFRVKRITDQDEDGKVTLLIQESDG